MEKGTKPLRVCVDARLIHGVAGGVESVIIGLASGLGRLKDGNEEYIFLVQEGHEEWIKPFLGPNSTLHRLPKGKENKFSIKVFLRTIAKILWQLKFPIPRKVPASDGTIESLGVDIMHFTLQGAFLTDVPSLYHPHDLQHLHLPDFFDPWDVYRREVLYRRFCDQAKLVPASTTWTAQDFIEHYHLPPEKVVVVPLAPINEVYGDPTEEELRSTRDVLDLPSNFCFYPAQTWPHKNHLRLVEAMALLVKRGVDLHLVCSGYQNDFFPKIWKRCQELGLEDRIHFVGFVSTIQLQCLYKLCKMVVIPTLFEAESGPLWDAQLAGAPLACSNVTSLPAQAGDSALIFDPHDPVAIANALEKLAGDPILRARLAQQGRERVAPFSWDRTARHFRAHYRRLAGRELTKEDRALLDSPPML